MCYVGELFMEERFILLVRGSCVHDGELVEREVIGLRSAVFLSPVLVPSTLYV